MYLYLCKVLQKAKQCSMILRAVNYSRGLQDFVIVTMCNLQETFEVSKALESTCDNVQLGVCVMPSSKSKSMYTNVCINDFLAIYNVLHTCIDACEQKCLHVCVCMYVCMYTYMYIYVHMYVFVMCNIIS